MASENESLIGRLMAELDRGEDAELGSLLEELGMIEAPAVDHDRALVAASALGADARRRLSRALESEASEELRAIIEEMGLMESVPPGLDARVLEAARKRPTGRASGTDRRRVAASAGLLVAWTKENIFAATMVASLASAVLLIVVSKELAEPPAPVAPLPAVTQWPALTIEGDAPMNVPSAHVESAPPIATRAATTTRTADRPLDEALAGAVGIGELHADGTLSLRTGVGLGNEPLRPPEPLARALVALAKNCRPRRDAVVTARIGPRSKSIDPIPFTIDRDDDRVKECIRARLDSLSGWPSDFSIRVKLERSE